MTFSAATRVWVLVYRNTNLRLTRIGVGDSRCNREVTRVESTGVVKIKINVVTRNMKQFGYTVPVATNAHPMTF